MEKLRRKFNRGKVGDNTSSYASYTRQSCNFVFPDISEKVNGETRPRPGKFRISNNEALKLDEAKDKENIKDMVKNNDVMKKYTEALNDFIKVTIDYFKTFLRKDKEKKYTLQDDVKVFFNKYKGKFSDFFENEKKKSSLFEILYQCSPKMITSIFYILKSPGSVLFYSNFVNAEGLQLFKIYLQFFGFIYLPNDENFSEKKIISDQKKRLFQICRISRWY